MIRPRLQEFLAFLVVDLSQVYCLFSVTAPLLPSVLYSAVASLWPPPPQSCVQTGCTGRQYVSHRAHVWRTEQLFVSFGDVSAAQTMPHSGIFLKETEGAGLVSRFFTDSSREAAFIIRFFFFTNCDITFSIEYKSPKKFCEIQKLTHYLKI